MMQESTSETTETQNAAPVEAQATEAQAPSAEAVQAAVEQYQPNFKFKVLDKEHEIDEFVRPVIKSKDVETKIRELYEKAYGLDHVKSERARYQEELKGLKPEYEKLTKGIDTLTKYLNNEDYDSFFKALQIPQTKIVEYAIKQAQLAQLPPEERQKYMQQRELQEKTYVMESHNQELQQRIQEIELQQRKAELNSALSQPTVQPIVQAFDQRHGQGKFWDEVVKRGEYYWYAQGRVATPQELVQELVNQYSPFLQTQQAPAQVQAQAQAQVSQKAEKPVIPVTNGNVSQSPAQRAVKSVADLRKMYQEME